MDTLDDSLHEQITLLSEEGNELAEQGDFAAALKALESAWELLPEPKTNWAAATWILAAMGDVHFLSGDFLNGRDVLLAAMHCPDAIGNPFLHLRLGQCQFELGDLQKAGDELTRAYMGGRH
jgi:tetratricopeptide (TPR) repeat protein